jgi:hypothetical protein
VAISVPCAKCATTLVAPDSAVGRQLRCPKCGALTTVPDFIPAQEVPVVEASVTRPAEPPPPPPAPRPKPVRAEAVDEPRSRKSRRDDDEDDDRPRKKKRRYAADDDYDHDYPRKNARRRAGGGGGGNGALIAGLVIGGLLLLAGVGIAVYFIVGKGKDKDSDFVNRTPVPPGWKQFSYPTDGFKAYFPSEPQVSTNPGRPRRGGAGFGWDDDLGDVQSVSTYLTGFGAFGDRTQVVVMVGVARYRNGVPRSVRNKMDEVTDARFGGIESRRVRWLRHDAAEVVMGGMLMRLVCTDDALIVAQIHGSNGGRARPDEEAGFFDNFELTK